LSKNYRFPHGGKLYSLEEVEVTSHLVHQVEKQLAELWEGEEASGYGQELRFVKLESWRESTITAFP
jgi:hypothetical protein